MTRIQIEEMFYIIKKQSSEGKKGSTTYLSDNFEEIIDIVRDAFADGANPKDIQVMSASFVTEGLSIEQIDWGTIAQALVKPPE